MAGAWAGLLLGASYTFWSQAIIGEVYTLHVLLVSTVLAAAAWWHRRPSLPRLAVLFGLYALGFGNHLMMVLLAPALVALIVLTPGGPRQVFSARGVGLAVACAVLGASQYAWNPPTSGRSTIQRRRCRGPPRFLVRRPQVRFAFDDGHGRPRVGVETSRRSGLVDLQQQVGLAGIVLSLVGLASLWRQWRILAVLVVAYLTAFGFAYT